MSGADVGPILNGPYDPPERHFELGPQGPTGVVRPGRRRSESLVPIPPSRKGKRADGGMQPTFDAVGQTVEQTHERRENNHLINDIRRTMETWRLRGYPDVTPTTRKLLQYWADPDRAEDRVLFCQREAVETAIYLAEVAHRAGQTSWHRTLTEENATYNEGLPRIALKMATGAGKTVVMAMLIAWQTANAAVDASNRYTDRFLVVAPGITIRDRLRVLIPGDPGNYYDERDLIPPDLQGVLSRAQIMITNFHTFRSGNVREIEGVNARTRKILTAFRDDDPFTESEAAMVARVLRGLSGRRGIVVLNDEAHHCYLDRPREEKLSREERDENEAARLWFRGLQAVARHRTVKQVYDLSATPYFLKGSGYPEGAIFPWAVSDFSLMEAIESGIVKIPRVPVDDDATTDVVTYLRLWDHVGTELPKRTPPPGWSPPAELEGALRSLYRSYERAWYDWESHLRDAGEPPPVFIVVCPNTVVSRLLHDWVAAELPLFRNAGDDGHALPRPVTILVDSARLESGEALSPDFRAAAAAEIEQFQRYRRSRAQGADVEEATDEDLLREVMNTVGKRDKLGADVRCVVSVAMLTEGWDANTVTHILGIRAFGSQLLCEQVVGRGLRRRSYAVDEDGRFTPEYANVYGVPFQFIRDDGTGVDTTARPATITHVESVPGREHLRISFPKVDGYRVEVPDEPYAQDLSDAPRFVVGPTTVPTWTDSSGIVGGGEHDEIDVTAVREQEVAFQLGSRLLRAYVVEDADDIRPWKFAEVLALTRTWLAGCVDIEAGFSVGHIVAIPELRKGAVEAVWATIVRQVGNRRELLRPILRRHDPVGSTANVSFDTRKNCEPVERSEVSHVTLDGRGGNTWEQILALRLNANDDVAAFAKNERLGFTIPYVHQGKAHSYLPDFLVRLVRKPWEPFDRTLIVEVSGSQKEPGMTAAKARTARDSWCVAVNNHGGFGRWGYVELTDMNSAKPELEAAIDALYEDRPIIGDPARLDLDHRPTR